MVYYRKYRPQTIDELDSTKVREQLKSVLASPDIPHAFLCTGPKGLGKTSTARIIAKVVNCEKRKKGEYNPCNECSSCVSITNGINLDVLEIDGASNRGIDEIRDLREKVKFAPVSSKKKVYIIDEVHMLTTEAFNALLKTIEEPPAHVMFLFCTTEPHKVPETIMSRCFRIQFHRATDEEIVHSLERIVHGEKLEVEKGALEEIAKMADGGFRDAAKMLEELVLEHGKEIKKNVFEQSFKTASIVSEVNKLLENITSQPPKLQQSLVVIQEVVNQGIDMRFFTTQLINRLHTILLNTMNIQGTAENNPENLRFDLDTIQGLTDLFSKAYQDARYAVIPQLPLEIALIKWCTQDESRKVPQTVATDSVSMSTNDKHTMQTMQKEAQALKVKSILHPVKEEPKKTPIISHEQRPLPPKHDVHASVMENLIYKTKPYNHSVAAVLRSCKVVSLTDTEIVIETPYKFHKERLDEKQTRDILEKALKEITGKERKITVELKK